MISDYAYRFCGNCWNEDSRITRHVVPVAGVFVSLGCMQTAFDESVWHPMAIFLPVMNEGKPAEPKLATICVRNFLQISIHSNESGHPTQKRAICQLYMNCIFMIINNLLLITLTRHG